MSNKKDGLFKKYQVTKLSNPEKEIDAIVLEFGDPIAHHGIWEWANQMREEGYYEVYSDTIDKLNSNGFKCHKFINRFKKKQVNTPLKGK